VRIHIATDHAGIQFSTDLQHHLAEQGFEVVDHGPTNYDPLDDYPSFCINAAKAVVRDQQSGVRAALVWSTATAELAREHNDANLISIGARQHSLDEAIRFIDTFLATPFSNEERHARRIAQLAEFEATGAISGHEID
jgi:ribose 5-phosphate isomerase B